MFVTLVVRGMAIRGFALGSIVALIDPRHFGLATLLMFGYIAMGRILIVAKPDQYASKAAAEMKARLEQLYPATVDEEELRTTIRDRYWFVALALAPFMWVGGLIGLSLAAALFKVGGSVDPAVRTWNELLVAFAGVDTANVMTLANIAAGACTGWAAKIVGWYLHDRYLFGPLRKSLAEKQNKEASDRKLALKRYILQRYWYDFRLQQKIGP